MADGFEKSLEELEKRVRRLEQGDVPLEEALTLFEEGVQLADTCQQHLEEAERRVAALSRSQQGIAESPLPDVET